MTTTQVVETSVTVNNNSPIQVYVHPDDHTQPFTIKQAFIFKFLVLFFFLSSLLLLSLILKSTPYGNPCKMGS